MGIFDIFREKESNDINELDIGVRENYGDNVREFDLNIEKYSKIGKIIMLYVKSLLMH